MNDLIESNERTLVMFDSVCSGLSACLTLVHADIRQMTEHRNRLAILDQELIQEKLVSPQSLASSESPLAQHYNRRLSSGSSTKRRNNRGNNSTDSTPNITRLDYDKQNSSKNGQPEDEDPHHLSKLKLLDKRLADSFSHALSMSDLQKSSITAKHRTNQTKPSIFQVLLGKTNKTHRRASVKSNEDESEQIVDNKTIIDDINRQTRLAMQYSKQLETHLLKVEELQTRYEMHLKMGLVVKSVTKAYLNSDSRTSLKRSRSESQQRLESKTTIKDFIENIDKIETEFESYMGSFLLAVEEIQGFARVCQGDVFEITIKYGATQKFKTKISVLKDRQKCDNRQTVFKARIADVFAIKAYECKGLGKRVLLGHKLCETRDLFTSRSQLMTISLNQTGSIKLNLIITWNPLHMAPNSTSGVPGLDISHISLPPTPVSSSTLSSMSSGPSMNGTMTTINIQSPVHKHVKSADNCELSNTDLDDHYHIKQHHNHESVYQAVDPTYGYYIPPPDYLTNDMKY